MATPFSLQNARIYAGIALLGLLGVGTLAAMSVAYFATPKYTHVGYTPQQPIEFSHKLHAGQLGMDCRYCHSHVEQSGYANIPAAQTCMNCHSSKLGNIKADSPALAPLREAWETGKPIEWIRIHKTPDFAFFDHSVHVARGVSCLSCHGSIIGMEKVRHDQPLSMSWCLDCHRNPGPNLRPADKVTDLAWTFPDAKSQQAFADNLIHHALVQPPTSCTACHR